MSDTDSNFTKAVESKSALVFARFIMPILISLLGAAGTVILGLVWSSVGEIKTIQTENVKQIWQTMGKNHDQETETSRSMGVLSQTVTDHIQKETDIDDQLKDIVKDHETRMRSLERPQGK